MIACAEMYHIHMERFFSNITINTFVYVSGQSGLWAELSSPCVQYHQIDMLRAGHTARYGIIRDSDAPSAPPAEPAGPYCLVLGATDVEFVAHPRQIPTGFEPVLVGLRTAFRRNTARLCRVRRIIRFVRRAGAAPASVLLSVLLSLGRVAARYAAVTGRTRSAVNRRRAVDVI